MIQDFNQIWAAISAVVAARISGDGYLRWFSDVRVVSDDGSMLVLSVPNPIHKFFIESNYLTLLQGAVQEACDGARQIQIVALHSEDSVPPDARASEDAPAPRRSTSRDKTANSPATTGMNPRYTFDSYVVGANNQFAYAASQAVAQS
ncbi:MAG: DnaA N-terminal domain-containing protein, partial [Chthoniobacterales bacterium]